MIDFPHLQRPRAHPVRRIDAATGKYVYNIATINSPTYLKFNRDDLRSRWQAAFGARALLDQPHRRREGGLRGPFSLRRRGPAPRHLFKCLDLKNGIFCMPILVYLEDGAECALAGAL